MVRVVDPTYYHEGKVIAPGPRNPLGDRWMGLDRKGYGIHGTNAPQSIGKSASHGCIRMAKRDLEELFSMVKVGDEVEIRSERDTQTAAIFGGDSPAQAADGHRCGAGRDERDGCLRSVVRISEVSCAGHGNSTDHARRIASLALLRGASRGIASRRIVPAVLRSADETEPEREMNFAVELGT